MATAGASATVTEGVGDGEFHPSVHQHSDLIGLFFSGNDSKSARLVIFIKIKLLYNTSVVFFQLFNQRPSNPEQVIPEALFD